ncbi:MAG: hypothetical protein JW709_01320 [Sedimentisphaerales bacterium]|nr:hypothetical protein [Sedimentisphaerales bacterium]
MRRRITKLTITPVLTPPTRAKKTIHEMPIWKISKYPIATAIATLAAPPARAPMVLAKGTNNARKNKTNNGPTNQLTLFDL